jgi:uncharacterized membrane protein
VPPHWLLIIQSFRIAVESWLWYAFAKGLIPRHFMNEPANKIVTEFPFIYLPGVLVVIAFVFHILSLRQIAISEK